MIFQILCYTIIIILLITMAIDLVPLLKDWVLRIHMGRYDDKSLWNNR